MIDAYSLTSEWIFEKRKKYKKDPNLMESMIHALFLLSQLSQSGLVFIFKGGTSLILLLDEPKRFSVDIDIIVNPKVNRIEIESLLQKIISPESFIRMELDEKRSYIGTIPKAHYKFFYKSNFVNKNKEGIVIANPEREILLDILFEENNYPVLIKKELKTDWVLLKDKPIQLILPDINSILGDKLTAFAPNTSGILYNIGKEKEIIKQLFDVACLFNNLSNLKTFKSSFISIANSEIDYRKERNIGTVENILMDIIETCLLIANKDNLKNHEDKLKFNEFNRGINQFQHYVFDGKFDILDVQVACSKAAHLAAIILKDSNEINYFNIEIPLDSYLISNSEYNFLNKRLKFVARGEALFYWNQTINLLYP